MGAQRAHTGARAEAGTTAAATTTLILAGRGFPGARRSTDEGDMAATVGRSETGKRWFSRGACPGKMRWMQRGSKRAGTTGKYGATAAGRRRRTARGVAHAKRRADRLCAGGSGWELGNAWAWRGWPEARTRAVAQSGEIHTANAGAEQWRRGN
jgi:hypothetical protein